MSRAVSIPKSQTTKLALDCWEDLVRAAQAKGVSPRAAAEGIIRTCTDVWLSGHCPQSAPQSTGETATAITPQDANAALDSLFD